MIWGFWFVFFYQAFLLHAIILSCGINLGKFLLLHFAILFCWAWLGISYPLCWFNFCFVFGKTPFKCASLCFQHILIPQFFSWLVVWWPTDTETCWTPSALPPPVHPLLEPCEVIWKLWKLTNLLLEKQDWVWSTRCHSQDFSATAFERKTRNIHINRQIFIVL